MVYCSGYGNSIFNKSAVVFVIKSLVRYYYNPIPVINNPENMIMQLIIENKTNRLQVVTRREAVWTLLWTAQIHGDGTRTSSTADATRSTSRTTRAAQACCRRPWCCGREPWSRAPPT